MHEGAGIQRNTNMDSGTHTASCECLQMIVVLFRNLIFVITSVVDIFMVCVRM